MTTCDPVQHVEEGCPFVCAVVGAGQQGTEAGYVRGLCQNDLVIVQQLRARLSKRKEEAIVTHEPCGDGYELAEALRLRVRSYTSSLVADGPPIEALACSKVLSLVVGKSFRAPCWLSRHCQ